MGLSISKAQPASSTISSSSSSNQSTMLSNVVAGPSSVPRLGSYQQDLRNALISVGFKDLEFALPISGLAHGPVSNETGNCSVSIRVINENNCSVSIRPEVAERSLFTTNGAGQRLTINF